MEKFGKYEVVEKIGVGGFATVYKGFDPHIKRFVAIKTCANEDDEMRRRFCQEAEIAGNLQHRNIVTVYDFGEQEDVPFLVQEYLTGEDLDRKIKRRDPLPYAERVLYLIQIARGLEYAHQKGVVHRDIKPANIRILEDSTARIMDFGIAKLAARQTGLTQTGMTLGTAAYLAPEQIRGESADQRTDIFSFGVLAHELLSYERPFSGEVISNVLYRILNQHPRPIQESWPECPPQLERIVARCIEKDPAKRYDSCTAVLADLDPMFRLLRTGPQAVSHTTGTHGSEVMPTAAIESGATAVRPAQSGPPYPHTVPTVPKTAAVPVHHVGDMALAHRSDAERRTPRSISTSAVYRTDQKRVWAYLAGGVAVLILAGGVWRFMANSGPPVMVPTRAAVASSKPPTMTGPQPASGARAGATPPGTTAPPAATPPVATPVAPPAPAPAPTVPTTATVTVPRAWAPEMTVAIDGGAAHRLDAPATFDVQPGNHVLSFSLVLPEYTDTREVSFSAKAGQVRRVETPLARPGQLTVQPALGSPVGMVRVDNDTIGLSPVRNKLLRAGVHRLEIIPTRAEAGQALSFDVSIQPRQSVVVTFNLSRPGEPPQVVARPLGSS